MLILAVQQGPRTAGLWAPAGVRVTGGTYPARIWQARIGELARGPVTIADLPALDHLAGAHADRAASLRDYGVGATSDALANPTLECLARCTL